MNFLKIIIKHIFSYKVRIIILLFSLIYCIILLITLYFLYVKYLEILKYLNTGGLYLVTRDITQLVSLHPLNINQFVINPDIKSIYYINGIEHYSNFIYNTESDLKSLHQILNTNPLLEARFSQIVLQDIIKEHTEEVMEVTHPFIRLAAKLSLPLTGSLLFLCISYLNNYGNSIFDTIYQLF